MDNQQIPFLENTHLGCSDVEELLDCYIDKEMVGPLRKRFEDHLSQCEVCRELVSDCHSIVTVSKTLDDEPIPAAVSFRLREALQDKVGHNVAYLRPRLTVVK